MSLAAALALVLIQDAPPAAFRYDAGQELRWRQKGEAVVAERIFDGREDGVCLHVAVEAELRLKVLRREGRSHEVEATPLSYRIDFKTPEWLRELKDGKYTDSRNEGAAEGLTKPFRMTILESGKREKIELVRDADLVAAWYLLDVLPAPRGSLLGWFGALPDGPREGSEWKSSTAVMLAREDFLTLDSAASLAKDAVKWSARGSFRLNREKTKYPGLVGAGEGTLTFDERGRASSVRVSWSAKTAGGVPLASFNSEITLTPVP